MKETILEEERVLPVLAVRGLVVFPGMIVQFDIGRKNSVLAAKAALDTDSRELFIVTQTDLSESEPMAEDLYKIGVIARIKQAGIVGMGGATFPTHVKISSGLGKVDYVIINAAECEPYITGDHRTMLERPEQVIKGATLLAKCFGVDKVYIGIEANKQNAADVLNAKIAELAPGRFAQV